MKVYGLIGKSLSHSFSKNYFEQKFRANRITDSHYELFELPSIDLFPTLLENTKDLKGLNVTIPYKTAVIPYLDEVDTVASSIQSVNTILLDNGKKIGYNTDVIGFEHSLLPWIGKNNNIKALILGSGGAAKAVKYVLQKHHIDYKIVSRTPNSEQISYNEMNNYITEYQIIINTTPLGMFPNINDFPPINYALITPEHYCYDLIYNPKETLFLSKSKASGASIKNGLEMLEIQAEEAWKIWNK